MGCRRRPVLIFFLLLLLPAVLLTGCWDRQELEDQAFIIFLGIDRGEKSDLLVTAEVTEVQGVAPGGSYSARLLTARADTITEALHILNAGMSRGITIKHLKGVLIGEALARDGVEPVLMELMRSPIARGSVWLAQARGRAFDIIQGFSPPGENNPGQATEGLILQSKRFHLAPPRRMQNFINSLAAPGGDPYLPAEGLNPGVTAGRRGEEPAEKRGQSARAGELARGGGNPMELVGTAVFARDRLVGFLNVDETQMLLALEGVMGKAYITFPDPDVPGKSVMLRFHQENRPKREAFFQGNAPYVKVQLLFEGEVLAAPGGTDFVRPENRNRLERAAGAYADRVSRDLLDKLAEWGADPVGFGFLFRSRFTTWQDWERYNWRSHVKDLRVTVTAKMRIRRYGLYSGPDRVKGGK